MSGDICQTDRIMEEYHYQYGNKRELTHIFDNSELKFSGHDDNGERHLCEISGHRFFIGAAFQTERSALKSCVYPLIYRLYECGALRDL